MELEINLNIPYILTAKFVNCTVDSILNQRDLLKAHGFIFNPRTLEWRCKYTQLDGEKDIIQFLELYYKIKFVNKIVWDRDDLLGFFSKYKFLYPFQLEALVNAASSPSYGIFHRMGLGKTIDGICLQQFFKKPALVVVLKSLVETWCSEHKKFPGYFEDLKINIINGSVEKRKVSYCQLQYDLNIIVYETLRNDIRRGIVNPSVEFILIADEASKLKNPSAKITSSLKRLRKNKNCVYMLALTGTPLENRLQDFYSIINLIIPDYMPRDEFTSTYCVYGEVWNSKLKRMVPVIERFKNLDRFRERIKNICEYKSKSEVLPQLPPLSVSYRFINHHSYQKFLMASLISEAVKQKTGMISINTLLKELDDGAEYLGTSESVTLKKLHPILSIPNGYVNPKYTELENILEEIGDGQALVFTQFAKVAVDLFSKIKNKYNCEVVTGGDSKRFEKSNEFKDKLIQLLISTDTLAYGMDYPDADYVINYDLLYNPEKMRQRSERIHRMISTSPKFVINFVGGGVERDAYNILKSKSLLIEQVVEGTSFENVNVERLLAEKYGFEV